MELTFITGNPNKLKQTQKYAPFLNRTQAVDLPEIQSLDAEEVVTEKVLAAFAQLGTPVIVEDTSLVLECIGRLPGPFIKWFLQEVKPEGICRLADMNDSRKAVATVKYAVHDGTQVQIFTGQTHGTIAQHPRGENGFGWDSTFIPDGNTQTWGEMTSDEQDSTSIRRKALEKLSAWIATQS